MKLLKAKGQVFLFLGLLSLSAVSSITFSEAGRAQTSVSDRIQLSNLDEIASSRAWRKLLFIPDRSYPSDRSLVDDPKFFLAAAGKNNPKAELMATLRAFASPDLMVLRGGVKRHPQCVYAARREFLRKKLRFSDFGIAEQPCPELDDFFKLTGYSGISLVFANYYLNNPASLFGHTFLRMHREERSSLVAGGLFDDSVNYAAQLGESESPLLYPFKGLMGFYPGQFLLIPYYAKLREYGDMESRDLWEYRLAMSPEDIRSFLLVLWEQGPFYSDYYFLDENCSYLLLATLEAAKPDLHLTEFVPLYAIPSDTVRAVARVPGLVTKVSSSPSNLSRYVRGLEKLEDGDLARLAVVARGDLDSEEWKRDCDLSCQARIMDVAVEFLDFKTEEAGRKHEADPNATLRQELLRRRAATKVIVADSPIPSLSQQPDVGHSTARIGAMAGKVGGSSYLGLHWRPALHDIGDGEVGYNDEMELRFLDVDLRLLDSGSRVFVSEVRLLELLSLPRSYFLLPASAWHILIGYQGDETCHQRTIECRRVLVAAEGGFRRDLLSRSVSLYGFAGGTVAYQWQGRTGFGMGPIATLGVRGKVSEKFILLSELHGENVWTVSRGWESSLVGGMSATYLIGSTNELRLRAQRDLLRGNVSLEFARFF